MANMIDRVRSRLPQFYNDSDSSNVVKLLNAFMPEFQSCSDNTDRVNSLDDIDQTTGEDLYIRWGSMFGIPRLSGESDGSYRARLKLIVTSLNGGTADSLKYSVAVGLGINEDPIKTDTMIDIHDAWEPYNGLVLDNKSGVLAQSILSKDSYAKVSKIEGNYAQTVTTQGKNLFDSSKLESGSINSSTGVLINSGIRLRSPFFIPISSGATFTISFSGNASLVVVNYYDVSKGFINSSYNLSGDWDTVPKTFTAPDGTAFIRVIFTKSDGSAIYLSDISNVQIELGSSATSYEAFVPNSPSPDYPAPVTLPSNFDIVACGKNLLDSTDRANSSSNGITLTVNADGSLTLNGTATASTYFTFNRVRPSDVLVHSISKLGGVISSGSVSSVVYGDGYIYPTSAALSTTIDYAYKAVDSRVNTPLLKVRISVASGTVCENLVIGQQIEVGTVGTDYEPHKGNSITIMQELRKLPDGVCDTIEKRTDGKTYFVQRIGKLVLDGSEDEGWDGGFAPSGSPNYYYAYTSAYDNSIKQSYLGNILVSNLNPRTVLKDGSYVTLDAMCIGYRTTNMTRIMVLSSRLSSVDLTGFKSWLASNPVTAYYELATPIETVIDDLYLISYSGTTNVYLYLTSSIPQVNIDIDFMNEPYGIVRDYSSAYKVPGNVLCIVDLLNQSYSDEMEDIVEAAVNNVKALGVKAHILFYNYRVEYYIQLNDMTYDTLSTLRYNMIG